MRLLGTRVAPRVPRKTDRDVGGLDVLTHIPINCIVATTVFADQNDNFLFLRNLIGGDNLYLSLGIFSRQNMFTKITFLISVSTCMRNGG